VSRRPGHAINRLSALLVATLMQTSIFAGEIPGLPPALLPLIERDFAIDFSNDFLGRGGSVDDFRTQQIDLTAKLGDRWLIVVDQSILTLKNSASPGRIDQLSASLGYQLINRADANGVDQFTFGGGVRSSDDYAGERMQNAFHRLVGSDVQSLPYVDTNDADLTAWFEAQRYRRFREYDSWSTGYWLRAGSLLTADGQWDSVASAMATASTGSLDFWFGVRWDWRNGYDADTVQIATARAEDDGALVLGVRFGALILETVQQFNNDASYGKLSLVSSGFRKTNKHFDDPQASVEFNFLLPDVQVQLLGKYRSNLLASKNSTWRESILLDLRYGKPQYGNNEQLFIDTQQLGVGMEWERDLSSSVRWVSFYGAFGAGWRKEQLGFEDETVSAQSESASDAVLTAGAGIRFNAASLGQRWNYRLQLGVSAWAPLNDARVQLNGEEFTLQESALAFLLGMSFDYSPRK
jgi:hypothetical protein